MKKYIIIGALLAVAVIVYVAYRSVSADKQIQYDTILASLGEVYQTVDVTGSVTAADQYELSFKRQGVVSKVNVKVGDKVETSDILAEISEPALLSEVDQARAMVAADQANLDKLLAGSTNEEVAISLQKVQKAETDLSSAQTALDDSKSNQSITTESYLQTGIQDMSDAVFVGQFALNTVYDAILDSDADSTFLTNNSLALNSTDTAYVSANSAWQTARQYQNTAVSSHKTEDILKALDQMRTALGYTSQLLDYGFETLAGTIFTSEYTETAVDSLKTSFNTRSSAVASEKTSIQTSINNLTTGLQTLTTAVNTAISNEAKAKDALNLAKAEYQLIIADPQSFEVKQLQAKLLQSQANLRSAQSKLEETVIRSSSDGVVSRVEIEKGEVAVPNQSVISVIGDEHLEIKVDIPESDITKIAIGQNAEITLDAFGLDRKFFGTLNFIEPSETLIQDVVYYKVTILFDEEYTEIKPGMTADIIIPTAKREKVLSVPIRSVISSPDGSKTVRILRNGQLEIVNVTVGIRGDEGNIEILSGLQVGDQVVIGEKKK